MVYALQRVGISFRQGVSGKELSTLRCGGTVDLIVYPRSLSELKRALALLSENEVPYALIGRGSNTLVKDDGFRGALISLKKLSGVFIRGNRAIASAGISLPYLSLLLAKNGLSGLEPLSGIPCSLGGATIKNAGCFGRELSELVSRVFCLDTRTLKTRILRRSEIDYRYHASGASFRSLIVLYTELVLSERNYDGVALIREYAARRRTLHPSEPSLGSVFRRTDLGIGAGYYLDKAGLKGTSIGGAEVSHKHANFIVNTGSATARDYLDLAELCTEVVKKKFNLTLDKEIDIIGENGFEQ